MRTFTENVAVRSQTPLLVGLVGPSGTGKSYSALRLAAGIQRVVGGDIRAIDTEANRLLHYADKFKFIHVPFAPPFSPLDYLASIEHCVKKGSKVIIIDSQSHEHEGPGGVLDMHEKELDRIAGADWKKRQSCTFLAWQKPKAERRKLIQGILQLGVSAIFCFRSKEKMKPVRGGEPLNLGWQPIAGEEFIYEMTIKCLLLPGADGVPSWQSELPGEKAMMKLPDQFRHLFVKPTQLSEDIGQKLAEWASGSAPATTDESPKVKDFSAKYAGCSSQFELDALESERKTAWESLSKQEKVLVKDASDAAKKRIAERGPDHVPGVGDPAND